MNGLSFADPLYLLDEWLDILATLGEMDVYCDAHLATATRTARSALPATYVEYVSLGLGRGSASRDAICASRYDIQRAAFGIGKPMPPSPFPRGLLEVQKPHN